MNPTSFAQHEYHDYLVYKELEKNETNLHFRRFLQKVAQHELNHYKFWIQFSPAKKFQISDFEILIFRFLRKIFGLTFVAKYLEQNERNVVAQYQKFLRKTKGQTRKKLLQIIKEEKYHETELVHQLKEEKVEFVGSMILGLNDSLIELTGILVGFSFIFNSTNLVAISGLVSGIAASLSMSASGYMQARYEHGKNEKKAALYTGLSYIFVVLLLVAPFFLTQVKEIALAVMFFIVFAIIGVMSIYTSVLFERSFKREYLTMFIFSIGVSIISFVIGSVLRIMSGINL